MLWAAIVFLGNETNITIIQLTSFPRVVFRNCFVKDLSLSWDVDAWFTGLGWNL